MSGSTVGTFSEIVRERWRYALTEPYDAEIVDQDSRTIAHVILDDAPVHDYNEAQELRGRLMALAPDMFRALIPFAEIGTNLIDFPCHQGLTSAKRCGRCGKVIAARLAIGLDEDGQ